MEEHWEAWVVTASAILGFLCLVAVRITKPRKGFGFLIDERNRYSLSRLQLVAWTILLVSAFLVLSFTTNGIDIYLAPEVWALMGISVGSAAGSVIVKGTKAGKNADTDDQALRNALGAQEANTDADVNAKIKNNLSGVLYVEDKDKTKFWDMFKGEEGTDHDYIDIGKVQMFFFTLAVITAYAVALFTGDLTVKPEGLPEDYTASAYFPVLSDSLVTLLGISHIGYLTVKAPPRTKTK